MEGEAYEMEATERRGGTGDGRQQRMMVFVNKQLDGDGPMDTKGMMELKLSGATTKKDEITKGRHRMGNNGRCEVMEASKEETSMASKQKEHECDVDEAVDDSKD